MENYEPLVIGQWYDYAEEDFDTELNIHEEEFDSELCISPWY